MPFQSEAQRRLCYVKQQEDLKKGLIPRWNCKLWEKETKTKLPERVVRKSPKRVVKKTSPKRVVKKSPKRVVKKSPKRVVATVYRQPAIRTISRGSACGKGMIMRDAYTRKTKSGKIVKVKAGCIKDQGKPGKGKKVFALGDEISLRKFGYAMSDSPTERHKALQLAVKAYGKPMVRNRLYKLSILFGNKPQLKNILNDIQYLK